MLSLVQLGGDVTFVKWARHRPGNGQLVHLDRFDHVISDAVAWYVPSGGPSMMRSSSIQHAVLQLTGSRAGSAI